MTAVASKLSFGVALGGHLKTFADELIAALGRGLSKIASTVSGVVLSLTREALVRTIRTVINFVISQLRDPRVALRLLAALAVVMTASSTYHFVCGFLKGLSSYSGVNSRILGERLAMKIVGTSTYGFPNAFPGVKPHPDGSVTTMTGERLTPVHEGTCRIL